MDTLRYDVSRNTIFYRIIIMDIRNMAKLQEKLQKFEEEIFEGKEIDVKEFYRLKKHLIDTKKDNQDLLEG